MVKQVDYEKQSVPFLTKEKITTMDQYFLPIILFLAGQTVIFITACITIYVRTMTKLKELEIRVQMVEKNEGKIFAKLDEVLAAVQSIDLKLERKQDKNN